MLHSRSPCLLPALSSPPILEACREHPARCRRSGLPHVAPHAVQRVTGLPVHESTATPSLCHVKIPYTSWLYTRSSSCKVVLFNISSALPPPPPVSKSPFLHDRLPLRSYSPIACNTPTRDACLRQPRPIKPAHFHIWVSRIARLLYLGAAAIGTTEHHFNSLPLSHTSGPATCPNNKIERTRSSRFDSFYSLVPPHLSATAISSSTSATTKYL